MKKSWSAHINNSPADWGELSCCCQQIRIWPTSSLINTLDIFFFSFSSPGEGNIPLFCQLFKQVCWTFTSQDCVSGLYDVTVIPFHYRQTPHIGYGYICPFLRLYENKIANHYNVLSVFFSSTDEVKGSLIVVRTRCSYMCWILLAQEVTIFTLWSDFDWPQISWKVFNQKVWYQLETSFISTSKVKVFFLFSPWSRSKLGVKLQSKHRLPRRVLSKGKLKPCRWSLWTTSIKSPAVAWERTTISTLMGSSSLVRRHFIQIVATNWMFER